MEKRKNNVRRIPILVMLVFALLITACLLVLPMTVSAAEGEPTIVTTEAELTEALAAGGNIQLGTDITVTAPYTIYKENTVTLDLSGFTLDMGANSIYNNGTFELRDSGSNGSLTGSRENVISNYGLFTLTSGTVKATNRTAVYISGSGARMVINGGAVSGGTTHGIEIPSGALTLNGGRVSTTGTYGIECNGGSITINSGEIEAKIGIDQMSGSLNMTGGTISATNWGIMCSGGTVTLGGGAITGGIKTTNSTLLDCLTTGHTYYNESGEAVTLTEGQSELTDTFTVAECTNHTGGTATCITLAVCELCKLEYGTYSYHADADDNDYCDGCNLIVITSAFPDANFRTYITENIDTDKDGVLSPEEIGVVTSINVNGKWISDLSGIEYFTELTGLDLTTNNLTSIDIRALSKLTSLNVRNNINLETLNLSSNLALEGLNISSCTSLRSLDLSSNTNLRYIEASGCALTSLDLSHSGAGLIDGSHSSTYITHCGVGYVNMNLLGDVKRMDITSGGTMGEDGWLLLDPDAADEAGDIWIKYNYDTGNGDGNGSLPVAIRVVHDDFSHTYVANTTSKDATQHYTEWCETCHTENEAAVAEHTYYGLPGKDETHHWQFCGDCGFKKIEEHYFTAACDETCRDCAARRDIPREQHTIYQYKDFDDTYHDAYCSTCSNLLIWEHEYAQPCTEACVCGRVNPDLVAHTPKYAVNGDMTHDVSCEVCAKLIEDNTACTDGDGDLVCDVCEGFMFPGLGTEQNPWQVDTFAELLKACIDDAFVELVEDIEFSSGGNVHISGTTHLCLNGHTLDLANSCIMVNAGGVLTVCNCAEGAGTVTARIIPIFNYGTLILSGDPIITNDPNGSGGNGAVTMYSGAKIDAAAYTGDVVTVDLVRTTVGDVIVENTTETNQDKFRVTTRGYTLELSGTDTLVMTELPSYTVWSATLNGYGANYDLDYEGMVYPTDVVTLTVTAGEGRKFLSVPTVTDESGQMPATLTGPVLQADGSYVFTLTNFTGDVNAVVNAISVLVTTEVSYMDENGVMQTTPAGVDVVIVEEETILLADGWYVVQDYLQLHQSAPTIYVSGNVKLILANTWIGMSDIRVVDGGTSSLTVYGTSMQNGALKPDGVSCPITVNSGSLNVGDVADLTMYGGLVCVTGTITQKTAHGGILFENGMGTVYGDITLTEPFSFDTDHGSSLTIPQGVTLTVNDPFYVDPGFTLYVDGTLTIAEGKFLENEDTMVVNGTVNGAVQNFGDILCGDLRIENGTYGIDFIYDPATDTLKILGGDYLNIFMTEDADGNPIAKSETVISVEGDASLRLFGLNIETAGVPLSIADGVACTVEVAWHESGTNLNSTATTGQYPGILIGQNAALTLEGGDNYLNVASASTSGIALSKDATLNVNGGRIDVVGGEYRPAIGSIDLNGTVTVTDGYITVGDSERGDFESCAGIYAKEITVSGGIVDVYVIGGNGIYASTVTIRGENTVVKTYGESGIQSGNLTIEGGTVTADCMSYSFSGGIHIYGGGSCTISGGTVNILNKSTDTGIYLEAANGTDADAHLSVTGGVLNIADVLSASSIGSNGGTGTGTVAISGGTVNVTQAVNVASASISGGTVNVTGAVNAASTSISGGTVTVGGTLIGTFTTTENGSAFISAAAIADNDDTTGWRGLIYVGTVGKIYGSSVTLTESATAPAGSTLTIDKEQTLTFADGAFLTVPAGATVNAYCTINGTDAAPSNPVSGFTGAGSFYHENPKLEVIMETTHIYTGEMIKIGSIIRDHNPIWWGGAEFRAISDEIQSQRLEKDGQPIDIYNGGYVNPGDVGKYTLFVTFGQDHEGNDIVRTFEFEVVAAELTDASVSQIGSLTYTGNAQIPTVNASATTVDGAAVTFTYCATENGTYTAELPAFTNAGTYTVYFKANAANHNETGGSFEIVVGKAANEWLVEPGVADWTYGETPSTPMGETKYGTVTFYYMDEITSSWSSVMPTEPGWYLWYADVSELENYEDDDHQGSFTIKKATPTVDLFDFTPPANLVCDGLAKEATVTEKEGIEGVGSITIKYFKGGEPIDGAPTTVGTYTVKIEVAEGANYEPATLTAEAWTFTFDITDETAHKNVTLVSNGNETHDKACSVCEKVIESGITCSGTTTDDCDKGYKCSCGGYFGTKEHNFTIPEKDSTDHWNECSDCGAIDEKIKHSATEDGDCKTEEKCSCGHVITVAKNDHSFDNACDTDCNNPGCEFTRTTEHTPEDDDDDCTTDILCSVCDAVTTKGNETHTGGTATCTAKAECSVCGTKYGSTLAHTPEADDGDCTTAVKCSVCQTVTTPANAAHTGGTATCQAQPCCSVCGTAYGELDANNHSKTTFVYTANADGTTHTKKYECCGVVALDSEAHTYGTDNKCVCGAEKPIPTYTVTVENGTASDGNTSIVVNENGSVTVTANSAPEGKQFKGWSVNGTVVSTEQSYTFNATADTTITAIYEEIPKNKGCGSAIGIGGSVIVVALIGFAVFFIRKKKAL